MTSSSPSGPFRARALRSRGAQRSRQVSSDFPGNGLGGIDAERLHRDDHSLLIELALIGQRLQRRDRDVVAIDFEMFAQRRSRVGAANGPEPFERFNGIESACLEMWVIGCARSDCAAVRDIWRRRSGEDGQQQIAVCDGYRAPRGVGRSGCWQPLARAACR
jgi:hypothetical protein